MKLYSWHAIKKLMKSAIFGGIGLYFATVGQADASAHIADNHQFLVPKRIVVAQTSREFEEQRERSKREFEEQSKQNRREFEETARRNHEWFDQKVKENNDRFDKFATIAIAFGAISLVVKLIGIYVASKRK